MTRWLGVILVAGTASGCSAANIHGDRAQSASAAERCPSRALDVDLRTCSAADGRRGQAGQPLEWGPTDGDALWAGRLRCTGGAVPARRRVGEGGLASATSAPRSTLPGDDELLELWELQCPGQPATRAYINPFRCGSPCPPAGFTVSDVRLDAMLEAAQSALAQDRDAEALDWARLALQQSPGDELALATLGQAALQQHAWPDAIRALTGVLALDPADPTARLGLALARVGLVPDGQGLPLPTIRRVATPARPEPDVRHARVLAGDVALVTALGALTGAATIDAGDIGSRRSRAIVTEIECLRPDGGWLGKALQRPEDWELLRQVLLSGETRTETWLRVQQADGHIVDIQRVRGPDGFARQLLADPVAALCSLEADLDTHEAALPPAWSLVHIHSEVSVPVLLGGALALMGAEMHHPELSPEQAVVVAGERWQAVWFESVSLARVLRMAREAPDTTQREQSIRFLAQVALAADQAMLAFATGPGLDVAAARSPALFRGVQVLRETTAVLHRALGLAEPQVLPSPPMDVRPDENPFRRAPTDRKSRPLPAIRPRR